VNYIRIDAFFLTSLTHYSLFLRVRGKLEFKVRWERNESFSDKIHGFLKFDHSAKTIFVQNFGSFQHFPHRGKSNSIFLSQNLLGVEVLDQLEQVALLLASHFSHS